MDQYPMRTVTYTIQPYDNLWLIAQRYDTTINMIAAANPDKDIGLLRIGQVINICPGCKYYPTDYLQPAARISQAEVDLRDHLRMLWEQHDVWTRAVIESIIFGLPDANLKTNRLLRNPKDFESALKLLYGDANADRFAKLLTDHLVIASQLVKASKAGNRRAAADAEKRWYANADEIARFLGSINPYWSEENWKNMLHEHLSLVKAEAVNILTRNYTAGINVYDEIEKQSLKMADVLTEGIVRQFPDKF